MTQSVAEAQAAVAEAMITLREAAVAYSLTHSPQRVATLLTAADDYSLADIWFERARKQTVAGEYTEQPCTSAGS